MSACLCESLNIIGVVIKNCVECFSNQEDRDEKRHKCMCVRLMYVRKYVYVCMNVVCL